MKEIRLSGREATVIRGLGFGLPVPGLELLEATRMSAEDLADVLNAMLEVGYVESTPFLQTINPDALSTTQFEVNSAYAHDLKASLRISYR